MKKRVIDHFKHFDNGAFKPFSSNFNTRISGIHERSGRITQTEFEI